MALGLIVAAGLLSRSGFATIDTNTNGLSDVWENVYSLTANPLADPDGDGQNNFQESVAGTDPLNSASVFRLRSTIEPQAFVLRWSSVAGRRYQIETAESPTAGGWQLQPSVVEGTGGTVLGVISRSSARSVLCRLRVLQNGAVPPRPPVVSKFDADGDGVSDFDEHFAGTDLLNAGSKLQITRGEFSRAIKLDWQGVVGKEYLVESATNMLAVTWQAEGSPLVGVAGSMSLCILPREQRQYYRVRVNDTDSDADGINDWEEILAGTTIGPHHFQTNFPTSAAAIIAMLGYSNVVNLEVERPTANVTRQISASLRVTRTGNLAPLIVHYSTFGNAVPGMDYQPLPGVVELPGGRHTVEIPILPLAEGGLSTGKTMGMVLLPGAGYTIGANAQAEVQLVAEIALSVKDFGAVGNGVVDDTAAIQAAIDALEASSNHNTLHFPAGVYRLNAPTSESDPTYAWNHLLKLGNVELAGRDLFFTGATGAVLYSTVHDVRANMIMARARFRSLTFRGLNWAKEPTALPETQSEPNQASGVLIINYGDRRVEVVEFFDCTFDNCHGAVDAFGLGFDLRGKLAQFGFFRCGVTNRYGPNTTNSWLAFGGGQQVRLNSWTDRATYGGNYFDGGSETPNPTYNPGGRMKDGSHYGSPLHLVFTNNVVRRMEAEAVHQNHDPYMATTASTFLIPPADGSTAESRVFPVATTFVPGQVLNYRIWFHANAVPTNVFLAVVAYNPTNRTITVTNTGLTPGVVGQLVPTWNSIYLSDYNSTEALIAGNLIESALDSGLSGITANARATIRGNAIMGYEHGVLIYESDRTPLHPPTLGLVIDSNVIFTQNSFDWPYHAYGILSYGPEDIVMNNLVVTPNSFRSRGILCRDQGSWIEGNAVLAATVAHYGYDSPSRSFGIGFGTYAANGTAAVNRTRGFDVGVGPEGTYQYVPHRVINHTSTNDVLAIDPIGLMP